MVIAWELVASGSWKGSKKFIRKSWENGQNILEIGKRMTHIILQRKSSVKRLPCKNGSHKIHLMNLWVLLSIFIST